MFRKSSFKDEAIKQLQPKIKSTVVPDKVISFEEWKKLVGFGKLYTPIDNPLKHYDSLEEAEKENKSNLIKKAQSNVQCNRIESWPAYSPVQH